MYGVSKLHNLVTLNLANNGILTIEGIKEMTNLQTLCLAGNNIKVRSQLYARLGHKIDSDIIKLKFFFQSVEHLHTNTKLEHLDLSENSISHLSDISYLRCLKVSFCFSSIAFCLFSFNSNGRCFCVNFYFYFTKKINKKRGFRNYFCTIIAQ